MSLIEKMKKKYVDLPIAARATFWLFVCSLLQKAISVISTPIFTRLMTTEQYGQVSVYNSWLQVFTIFTTLRLDYGVFNTGMSRYRDNRDEYTATMQNITLVFAGVFLCIYFVFRKQINALTELPTFIMVAMFIELMFTPATSFWTHRKRYEYIYKPVIARTLLMSVLNIGLSVVAVVISTEKDYAKILAGIVVNIAFGSIFFFINNRVATKKFVFEYAKYAILFSLPLILHYLGQYALDQFDRIMIQKFVGLSAAGLYSVAYSAGLIMKLITNNLNTSMVPWLYGKLEEEKVDKKKIDDTYFLLFLFIGVIAVVYSSFAPEIILIMAGSTYYEAIYVVPPVAIGIYFLFLYTVFANVEFYYKHNKFTMFITLGNAVINVITNYIFIKMFGYVAAAYTTLACYMISAVAHYCYLKAYLVKHVGYNYFDGKRISTLSMGVLVGGIAVIYLYDKPVIRYIIMFAIVLLLYIKRKYFLRIIGEFKRNK